MCSVCGVEGDYYIYCVLLLEYWYCDFQSKEKGDFTNDLTMEGNLELRRAGVASNGWVPMH